MSEPSLDGILDEVEALRAVILADAEEIAGRWAGWIENEDFAESALNFAQYLAFRRQDIRPLQRRMMQCGLSSLGRAEGRVMATLDAVLNLLRAATGRAPFTPVPTDDFFSGAARIAARAEALFGPNSPHRPVSLLVTLPGEAAENAEFVLRLARMGVETVRINCAHDDETTWKHMIANVDRAAERTGRRMKVLMDLAGPKLRTGPRRTIGGLKRVVVGDEFALTLPGQLDRAPDHLAAVECSSAQAIEETEPGQRILIDDGKLVTKIVDRMPWGVLLRVTAGPMGKGYKLKPEKGINFPGTDLRIPALTGEDIAALPFIVRHADGVEFSFVQSARDVAQLQDELARLRPDDWQRLSLVLKIETSTAIRNLPDMLVRAAGRQPAAVMIARGDLAAEIGFARLAEMQEEILWLCEAAQVPVIWATQVLEGFVKTGVPSRGEMTDAAMATRAECVMLNKGPNLFEVITELDRLLLRMSGHLEKKTPQMRPLKSW